MTRYDRDAALLSLLYDMQGRRIRTTALIETNTHDEGGRAVVCLELDDGRTVEIGVAGNLHDEAFLVLQVREGGN